MLLRFAPGNDVPVLAEPSAPARMTQEAIPGIETTPPPADVERALLHTLQRSLDTREVLRRFSRLTRNHLGHSGIRYRHRRRELEFVVGRQASCQCDVQLQFEHQSLGEMCILSTEPLDTARQATLVHLLAWLVYPLRNALRYHDATTEAVTDELTGVHNRGYLELATRREMGLARRHEQPLSLVIIDVDDFKFINDQHGHLVGDEVLKCVARRLQAALRDTDILARYGGDEFTVLLHNTGRNGAVTVARTVFEQITQRPFRLGELSLPISVTLGVATRVKSDQGSSLFERADAALYEAKGLGGGRIAVATRRVVRLVPDETDLGDAA